MTRNGGVDNVAYDNTENVTITQLTKHDGRTINDNDNKIKVDVEEQAGKKLRPEWENGTQFLMSCISLSVGLGNIWRFPFTAYENGGGAFLIPYIIVLVVIGKPIYYMELALGQFTSQGSVKAIQAVPIMKGIGIGQQIGTTCVVSYYCSLIALTLFYMFKSFATELPWARCWISWGKNCIDAQSNVPLGNRSLTGVKSSSELYFLKEVIKQKDSIIDGIGWPDWQLTIFLLLAWLAVYIVIAKGVKSSGKFSYFLALFPYVVMIILLIRAVTLDGAIDGIKFFIYPDFKKLIEPKVWYEATTQLFFSLSVGMGTIIMFSSYNKFSHDIYRDAMIVTSLDTFTSLLGGFTIFGILGNLAHNLGEKDISNVVKAGGSGLAFISYPEAIAKFTFVPQFFAVLFFFMLFVLGVGSAVGLQSSIVTNLMDIYPKTKQWKMAGVCSLLGFLVGLIYITPGGQYMLSLIDYFGGTFLIFALAIFELVGIFWIYGIENFCWDLEFMLKRPVTPFWRLSWFIFTPVIMISIFIYSMWNFQSPTFGGDPFPVEYLVAGWIIFLVGMIQVAIWAAWSASQSQMNGSKTTILESLFTQNPEWGPKSPKIRQEWRAFREEALEKRIMMAQVNNHTWLQQKVWIVLGKYR